MDKTGNIPWLSTLDSRQIFLTVNKVLLSKEEKSEENNTTRPLFPGLLAEIVSSDRAEFQTQKEFSSCDPDKKGRMTNWQEKRKWLNFPH